MTRTALPTAVLIALTVVCLPLRADDAFTLHLKEAVYQLTQHGQEPINEYPSSVMAQNLARLVSETGNQLLLQNEHMETQKTPDEERIPILRELYLRQMRRIHELEPDGKSIALYNERLQSLAFYYFGSPGGGGGLGSGLEGGFASKLRSLLVQGRTTVDSAGFELMFALLELRDEWLGFEHASPHRSKVSHIVDKELVRPNSAGLWNPPPPTPPEQFMNQRLYYLMWQIEYELTKLDVELAEQKTPREERAKKLRNHFFKMIRKVKYIGLEVLVEGDSVKIPFRDARGPILDSAGAPIVFEFPPKLMAALMISSASQGSAKRLQLLLGGGAAVLLLVLAGVFFVMKRDSAKEADHSAEAES